MFCDQCGCGIPDMALFCKNCGSTTKFKLINLAPDQLQSLPKINFQNAVLLGFQKYFQVRGRSRRAEFWWFILFQQVCALAGIILLAGPFTVPFITPIGCLILSIPSITITTRRLHDIGLSGWWQLPFFLASFFSFVGTLILLFIGLFIFNNEKSGINSAFFIASGLLFLLLIVLISIWVKLLSKDGQQGQNKFGQDPKSTQNLISQPDF